MCAVSNIGDYTRDYIPKKYPWADPYNPTWPQTPWPGSGGGAGAGYVPNGPTQEQFDALKKEVEEIKKLLLAAKKFDESTDQPHCEHGEKVEYIKKLMELCGVNPEDIFE